MKKNITNVTCGCGLVIPDDKIDYSNRCEEGDDYYEVIAKCECGKEYECSEWGECENLTEAKEYLIEYINDCG